MTAIIAAIFMGLADLYRGSEAGPHRVIEKLGYALLALFALLGLGAIDALSDWRFAVLYLAAFSAGASISWGTPIGGGLKQLNREDYAENLRYDREVMGRSMWYLRGYFKRTAMRGLVARGFIWGILPATPLAYFVGWEYGLAMLAAYTVAMPAAVAFVLAVDGKAIDRPALWVAELAKRSNTWSRQEVYRGWFAGALLVAASLPIQYCAV